MELPATPRSSAVRRRQRATHDLATIRVILDEALVCHIAIAHEGTPLVLPTAFVRIGDALYVHGARANHLLSLIADGAEACVEVTLVDGLVLAKTAAHHSVNYRSVVLFGRGRRVDDPDEALLAFRALVDKVAPGRYACTLPVEAQDFATTVVVAFPIVEGSAKVRSGPPLDEPEVAREFVGVLPLRQVMRPAEPTAESACASPLLHALDRMTLDDAPEADEVMRIAYNHPEARAALTSQRLRGYLRIQPDGWFVARADHQGAVRVVGTAGALSMSDTAFVGLVAVLPHLQRRGVARLLMARIERWAEARGLSRLLLDASEVGEPLYAALGYTVDDQTLVLMPHHLPHGATMEVPPASPRVRPAGIADLEAIRALDGEALGLDRTPLLREWLSVERVLLHEAGGYAIANAASIGPVVAPDPRVARELVDAALALPFTEGPSILTRASHPYPDERFRVVRRLAHMRKGGAPLGRRDHLFALQSLATN